MQENKRDSSTQYYKGFWLTTYRGIALCFISFLIYLVSEPDGILISFAFLMFFGGWLPMAYAMNYFGVSKDTLLVRHHFFIWKRKRYPLADIKQVILHSISGPIVRDANRLTIVFNNDTQKSFQGSTLRNYHWIELIDHLKKLHVNVKDENQFVMAARPETRIVMRKVYRYFITYLALTLGSMSLFFIDAPNGVILAIKLFWLVGVLGGIFLVKRLIIKAAKEVEPDDNHNKPPDEHD